MTTIASTLTLANGVTAPNRLLKSAMTEMLCEWNEKDPIQERGRPTPAYLKIYEEWAKGKTGIIVLGNIPCDARYPEAPGNACIDMKATWDQVAAFKPVIAATKAHGALCIGQVTHAGRQTDRDIAPEPVSASDVQSAPLGGRIFNKPRPMTVEEIKELSQRFAHAAKVLYDAGADGIQLHCAHGYLLSQFLSPRVNKRTDDYGGSLENRSRVHFEIIDAVRKAVPDEKFILSIKINSQDFIDGGLEADESRTMCQRLEGKGMTLIELSGGTYESGAFHHKKESTKKREAFFIEFADRIRPTLNSAKLAVTGGFRSVTAMNDALAQKSCDVIGLARPLTAETDLSATLIEAKSDAAKVNLVNESLQTPASIYQIQMLAHKGIIPDFADQATAKRVEEGISTDMRAFVASAQEVAAN